MLPGLVGIGGFSVASMLAQTFTDGGSAFSPSNPYTFSGLSIGAATSDRYILVIAAGGHASNGTMTACTVAGQTCTRVGTTPSGALVLAAFITDAPVTSGTTASVVITSTNTLSEMYLAVFTITGGVPVSLDSVLLRGTTARNGGGLDVAKGGCSFAAFYSSSIGSNTWTGVTEVTDSAYFSAASLDNTSDQSNRSVSTTNTAGANAADAFLAVSFSP